MNQEQLEPSYKRKPLNRIRVNKVERQIENLGLHSTLNHAKEEDLQVRIRLVGAILALVLVLGVAMVGSGSAKESVVHGPLEIERQAIQANEMTGTARGIQQAKKAAQRFERDFNIKVAPESLRVFRVPGISGGIIVTPADFGVKALTLSPAKGGNTVELAVTTAPGQAGQKAPALNRDASIESQEWIWVSGRCWSYEDDYSTMSQCYKLHKFSELVDNGGTDRRPWALHHYATAGPKSPLYLLDAYVRNQPYSSPTTYWADWDPGSDSSVDCCDRSIGVSVAGVSISYTYTQCEKWDITKYSTPGKFKNEWSHPLLGVPEDREVAYAVEVYADDGDTPRWTLYCDRTAILPGT